MSALSAAQSLSGCRPKPEVDKMVNFFSDPDNRMAIMEASDKLGAEPPNNRPSTKRGGLGLFQKNSGWTDYCDWQAVYDFYNYAKISFEFPKPAMNKEVSCGNIKSALVGLESAKQTAIANGDTLYKKAIDMKISEYNSIYASLNCDQYILDQERFKTEEAIKRQEILSSQLASEAFDKASGTTPTAGSKTGTYVLYGFVGLSAIVFLTVLLKKN
jgi:hypothetical protein